MGQGPIWTLWLTWRAQIWDPNWSERSAEVLWWVGSRDSHSATNWCTPFVCILKFHNSRGMPLLLLWKGEHVTYPPIIWHLWRRLNENLKDICLPFCIITCCQLCHKPTGHLVKSEWFYGCKIYFFMSYVFMLDCLHCSAVSHAHLYLLYFGLFGFHLCASTYPSKVTHIVTLTISLAICWALSGLMDCPSVSVFGKLFLWGFLPALTSKLSFSCFCYCIKAFAISLTFWFCCSWSQGFDFFGPFYNLFTGDFTNVLISDVMALTFFQ